MEIRRSKSFLKSFASLGPHQQEQIESAVVRFVEDRSDPILRNHRLKGKMRNFYSISAAWDLRIIYQEKGNFLTVILVDVGTHNQVY